MSYSPIGRDIIDPTSLGKIADEIVKLFESEERLYSFIKNYNLIGQSKNESAKKTLHIGLKFINNYSGTRLYGESNNDFRKQLFQIIEDVCNPILHIGREESLEKFIEKLNKTLFNDGCIIVDGKLWEKAQERFNTEGNLIIPNNNVALYIDKEGAERELNNEEIGHISQANKIESLIVVRPEDYEQQFIVIVNQNYKNPIKVRRGKRWEGFFRIAEEERLPHPEYKYVLDYMNTTKKNKLYTSTKAKLTNILKIDKGKISKNIPINVITKKAFQQRKNKAA